MRGKRLAFLYSVLPLFSEGTLRLPSPPYQGVYYHRFTYWPVFRPEPFTVRNFQVPFSSTVARCC